MGTWSGRLPGIERLATEAGVSKLTMRAAMRLLEEEGLVLLSEDGYSRYLATQPVSSHQAIRIGILMAEPLNEETGQFQHLMIEIQNRLEQQGFAPFFFNETLSSLRHDVKRISEGIAKAPVDACIVVSGSREVLEWFGTQEIPCLALFGRADGLSIASAGADKTSAYAEAARHFVELGHRRIVLLNRKARRLPSLGLAERSFIQELEAHGIEISAYNLPDWEETPEGFRVLLAKLFKVTPPTALMIDELRLWVAVQQHLVEQGLSVPDQVSIVVTDHDPVFAWCSPSVAHIRWENEPIVRRVVRWAGALNQERKELGQALSLAKFIVGGTVGPVPKKSD